jgi:transposase InsO family protein
MDDATHDRLFAFLTRGTVPDGYNKAQRDVLARRARSFAIQGERLVEIRAKGTGSERRIFRERRVILASELDGFLEREHILEGTHESARGMARRISARFYLDRNLHRLCRNVVEACALCRQRTAGLHREPELRPIRVSAAFERLAVDFMGPFPPSACGNRYILLFVDHFTKWVIALPTANKEATTVARALLERVYPEHGAPAFLQSDRGTEFINSVITEVARFSALKHTAAYHPQANGAAERANQTLLDRLGKLVNDERDNWDILIAPILYSIRTSYHASIRCSPFYALYGRHPRHPFAPTAPSLADDGSIDPAIALSVDAHAQQLRRVHELASDNLRVAQARQKAQHDKTLHAAAHRQEFQPGDRVRVKEVRPGKLCSGWLGPFTIGRKLRWGSYVIEGYDIPVAAGHISLYVPEAPLARHRTYLELLAPGPLPSSSSTIGEGASS